MLDYLDFLGPEVKLYVKSKENFKTGLGALASLFMLIMTIAAFIGFGSDIFYRTKPKVTFNRIVNDQTQNYNITDQNFLFSIYDQYTGEPIPDFDRRYTPYFQYFQISESFKITTYFFEKCSPKTIERWDGYYDGVGSSNYLCFPKNSTFPLSGVMLQGTFTMIRLQLSYCQNNTDPEQGRVVTNCIPKLETVKFLEGKRVQMHYIIETTLVDTNNYTNPQSITAYTGYANTDPLTWSRTTILFKTLVTDTDEGFFIESKKSTSFSALESIQPEAIYSPETTAVFSHLIGNSRYKETYTRVYIKIQDIFAMMGGFINSGLIILKFIVAYFKRPDLINLFNSISKYQPIESKKLLNKIEFGENLIIPNDPKSFPKSELLKSPDVNFEKNKTISFMTPERKRKTMSSLDLQGKIRDTRDDSPFITINGESPSKLVDRKKYEEVNTQNQNENVKNKEEILLQTSEVRKMQSNSLKYTSIFFKKRNYSFKFNSCTRTFKCCFTKEIQNQTLILNRIEKKMFKTISFENLTNITKYSKLFKEILLEKYQDEIFQMCSYPKEKQEKLKISALKTLSEKLVLKNRRETFSDKLDMKLYEYLKK